jgi:hypothetical protein
MIDWPPCRSRRQNERVARTDALIVLNDGQLGQSRSKAALAQLDAVDRGHEEPQHAQLVKGIEDVIDLGGPVGLLRFGHIAGLVGEGEVLDVLEDRDGRFELGGDDVLGRLDVQGTQGAGRGMQEGLLEA